MPERPLDAILALGERMCEALEADDVDAFCALVEERDRLIHALTDADRPADIERAALVITDQHARIQAAMDGSGRQLDGKIGAFTKFRSARQAYRQRPVKQPQRLNKHLRG